MNACVSAAPAALPADQLSQSGAGTAFDSQANADSQFSTVMTAARGCEPDSPKTLKPGELVSLGEQVPPYGIILPVVPAGLPLAPVDAPSARPPAAPPAAALPQTPALAAAPAGLPVPLEAALITATKTGNESAVNAAERFDMSTAPDAGAAARLAKPTPSAAPAAVTTAPAPDPASPAVPVPAPVVQNIVRLVAAPAVPLEEPVDGLAASTERKASPVSGGSDSMTLGMSASSGTGADKLAVPAVLQAQYAFDARERDRGLQDDHLQQTDPISAAARDVRAAALLPSAAPAADKSADVGNSTLLGLHQRFDSPEFPQALADRVGWMIDRDMTGAKLSVNPPHLGPIEIRIEVKRDQASVWFTTHNTMARDALDSSTATLKDLLGSQGFSNVNVDISQRSFQDRATYPSRYEWIAADDAAGGTSWPEQTAPVQTLRSARSQLDAYA